MVSYCNLFYTRCCTLIQSIQVTNASSAIDSVSVTISDMNRECRSIVSVTGRCGKHESENKRSETEIVRPCGEKDWRRCSNENMEVGGHWKIGRPILRWGDVIRKYMKEKQVKIEVAQDQRTWRLKTRSTQIGKRPKKKQLVNCNLWKLCCTVVLLVRVSIQNQNYQNKCSSSLLTMGCVAGGDLLRRFQVEHSHHEEHPVARGGGQLRPATGRPVARLRHRGRTRTFQLHSDRPQKGTRRSVSLAE